MKVRSLQIKRSKRCFLWPVQLQDDEIAELKDKMNDMAEDFGDMLRETLEKMRERIEVSNGNFDAPDLMIQQRMEELKLNDSWRD